MDLYPIFEFAESTWVGAAIRDRTWPFPLIETFHIMALAVFMGALFLIDLRLLGFKMGGLSATRIYRQTHTYINWGIAAILITGALLFASEGEKLYNNAAFMPKMYAMFGALIWHYTGHKIAVSREEPPAWGGLAGALSLVLWFFTGAAGRAIGFV